MSEKTSTQAAEALCGDGADARYCPVFWSKSAECDDLREKLAAAVNPTAEDYDNAAEILQLRDQLTGIRERLENLAAGLEMSASASSPSKKSEIERGCAEAVRGIAAEAGVKP